jgi:xylulose-5-phosphate/fructose-6-phosphate phosphoketolase
MEAKKDPGEREELTKWLSSYNPHKLLPNGEPNADILKIIPEDDHLKLGRRKEAYASYESLDVPNWMESGNTVEKGSEASCMKIVGEYLHEVIKRLVMSRIRSRSCVC